MPGFRETKKEIRHSRIHKAAMELLEEKGFANTRMRDISQRAELAVGTLYNYYPSKHELYMRILEARYAQIRANMKEQLVKLVCTGDNLLEILMGIITPFMQVVTDFEEKGLSELISAMFSSKSYVERGAAMDMDAIAGLEQFIRKLQKRGLVDPRAEPGITAMNIYSVIGFQVLGYIFIPGMGVEVLNGGIRTQLKQLISGIDKKV